LRVRALRFNIRALARGQLTRPEECAVKYDVFISYSHEDAGWAKKLKASLDGPGCSVFLDDARLTGGEKWEQSLSDAVRNSKHLLFLSSPAARDSDWVRREVSLFEALTADPTEQRRLIAVNLEGANKAYASLQSINTLRDAGAYGQSPDVVDPNVWQETVDRIKTAIEDQDQTVKITVAVLTLTADEADPAKGSRLAFNDVKQSFDLEAAAVKDRYGATRLDWRPYGAAITIRTMIDRLVDDLNGHSETQFSWRAAPDALWDAATITDAAARLAEAPLAIVVVDTVALAHPDVYRTMMTIREYLKRSVCAWLIIPPVPSDARLVSYRTVVTKWSMPLLRDYFEPPIPHEALSAQYGIYCGDHDEIRRLLRLTAGEYVLRRGGAGASDYLQVRRT
jgi:TIR domain-containing protein